MQTGICQRLEDWFLLLRSPRGKAEVSLKNPVQGWPPEPLLRALVLYTYLFQKHTHNCEIMFLIKHMLQSKQNIFIKMWKFKMSVLSPPAQEKRSVKYILLIFNIM